MTWGFTQRALDNISWDGCEILTGLLSQRTLRSGAGCCWQSACSDGWLGGDGRGGMGRVTRLAAVGASRRRRKKPVFAGRVSERVVPMKPSGTVVGVVKA